MVVYLVDASPKMFTPATTQVRHCLLMWIALSLECFLMD
jgi:hypothetical protein